jgi:hypothetical protein
MQFKTLYLALVTLVRYKSVQPIQAPSHQRTAAHRCAQNTPLYSDALALQEPPLLVSPYFNHYHHHHHPHSEDCGGHKCAVSEILLSVQLKADGVEGLEPFARLNTREVEYHAL